MDFCATLVLPYGWRLYAYYVVDVFFPFHCALIVLMAQRERESFSEIVFKGYEQLNTQYI